MLTVAEYIYIYMFGHEYLWMLVEDGTKNITLTKKQNIHTYFKKILFLNNEKLYIVEHVKKNYRYLYLYIFFACFFVLYKIYSIHRFTHKTFNETYTTYITHFFILIINNNNKK